MKGGLRRVALLVGVVAIAAAGCAPAGPSYDELVTEPVFAATMPGASQYSGGGDNKRHSMLAGDFDSYAVRFMISPDDENTILEWHRVMFEADGWTPATSAIVYMADGKSARKAWRRGKIVIGLGFMDRGWMERNGKRYPAGTLYHESITYQAKENY